MNTTSLFKTWAVSILTIATLPNVALPVTVVFEDFEDSALTYTGPADSLSDGAARDYYGRTDLVSGIDITYSNLQGLKFYGAQDTDGAGIPLNPVVLNWTGINISSFTNLQWSGFFAEDTAGDFNEDWDITTSVHVEVQIDGGGFNRIFAIESINSTIGNRAPAVDTNFDGLGDGVAITDTFTQFSSSIANGSTLDLRISIIDLDTGDEDIAFDNILITGDLVPEPSSGLLSLLGAILLLRRRR